MANEFVARNGIISKGDLTVSGSIATTSPINLTGFATGSVLFTSGSAGAITGSSNLFWDDTNKRLNLNLVTGATNYRMNFRSPELGTRLNGVHFTDGNDTNSYGYIALSGTSGEMRMFTGTTYFPTFYSNGVERLRIASTGNVLINTTTDAGFNLDVNGTARVSDNVTISKTIDGITSLSLLNGSGGTTASSRFYLGSTNTQVGKLGSNYTTGSILKSGDLFLYNQTVGNITFWNNLSTGNINFTTGNGTTAQMTIAPTGNVLINTATDVASSKLTIESTTQGFLPPRMTTTQKNAIATPATGLELYDTTLNQKSYYDGTSWTNIPSTRNEYKSVPATLGGIVGGAGTTNGVIFSTQTPIFKTGGQIIDVDLTYITSTLNVSTNLRVYRSDSPNTIVGASLMDTVNYTFTTGTTDIYADGIRYRKRYFVGLDVGSEIIYVPTQLVAKPNDMYVPLNSSGPTVPLNTFIIANNYLVFTLNQSAKFLGGTITY